MKKIYYWLNIVVLIFVIYATGNLVLDEFEFGNRCPEILGIPACYIVLSLFTLALLIHVIGQNQRLYFISIGTLFLIATFGSIGELTGMVSCPKTSGGIPMCYISFAICTILLVLKYRMITLR